MRRRRSHAGAPLGGRPRHPPLLAPMRSLASASARKPLILSGGAPPAVTLPAAGPQRAPRAGAREAASQPERPPIAWGVRGRMLMRELPRLRRGRSAARGAAPTHPPFLQGSLGFVCMSRMLAPDSLRDSRDVSSRFRFSLMPTPTQYIVGWALCCVM